MAFARETGRLRWEKKDDEAGRPEVGMRVRGIVDGRGGVGEEDEDEGRTGDDGDEDEDALEDEDGGE